MNADWLERKHNWSVKTFGPGPRTEGICKHIEKELIEIRKAPADLTEWVDVILLALDGAARAGHSPNAIIMAMHDKQLENYNRKWGKPAPQDQPNEHIR